MSRRSTPRSSPVSSVSGVALLRQQEQTTAVERIHEALDAANAQGGHNDTIVERIQCLAVLVRQLDVDLKITEARIRRDGAKIDRLEGALEDITRVAEPGSVAWGIAVSALVTVPD